MEPDEYDLADDADHGSEPRSWRVHPEHHQLYQDLYWLGDEWYRRNLQTIEAGAPLPDRRAREVQLHAVYERYASRNPGRIATARELVVPALKPPISGAPF